jgi:hypothetical protein
MDELVSDVPFLANIIILTAYFYADTLDVIIKQNNPNLNIIIFEHPNEILLLPTILLSKSRLISFGSRFYVGAEILNKLGFAAYNFHPGPPNYPGWAPFNFALYDGVDQYGVTVHEMTETIDAGTIVGEKSFDVQKDTTLQELMDLTTENMYVLFNVLAFDFVHNSPLKPILGAQWSGTNNTRKLFTEKCKFTLDMSKDEFDRRIKSFGDGDGERLPFIIHNEKLYEIAGGTENAQHESIWLHDIRFTLKKHKLYNNVLQK